MDTKGAPLLLYNCGYLRGKEATVGHSFTGIGNIVHVQLRIYFSLTTSGDFCHFCGKETYVVQWLLSSSQKEAALLFQAKIPFVTTCVSNPFKALYY